MRFGGYFPVRQTPQGESAGGAFLFGFSMENFDRLSYNPETGVFTWVVSTGSIMAGRVAAAEQAHEAYVCAKRKLHQGCTI